MAEATSIPVAWFWGLFEPWQALLLLVVIALIVFLVLYRRRQM